MSEIDEVKAQNVEANGSAPTTEQQKALAARREFLRQAIAITSAIALIELFPSSLLQAATEKVDCTPGDPLIRIGEIKSNGTKLQAVLKVVNGERTVPNSTESSNLRYYQGYNPADKENQNWPPKDQPKPAPPGNCGPGPTFRCSIGDEVQITFLNQVNIKTFPKSALISRAEVGNGSEDGCDKGRLTTDPDWYPKTTGDKYPNCFHASSAANVHFHGTHVTPSTTGDNVLVNVWPWLEVTEADVEKAFRQIFDSGTPKKWTDLPQAWRDYQMGPPDKGLIGKYDLAVQYGTGHGLPPDKQLWPANQEAIEQGLWPQFYVGSYPFCFKIPKYTVDKDGKSNLRMGQSPGTHWYHSHKHGSTALNLFNGLAGALIIEDNSSTGYDGALKGFYAKAGHKLDQVVLVFQQIDEAPNLLAKGNSAPPVFVNGQNHPKITMRPGQVLLWRMINACVQQNFDIQFNSCNKAHPPPRFRQTAQDGVQFAFANYIKPKLPARRAHASKRKPERASNGQQKINMAPANRVDLLVKAPPGSGQYVLGTTDDPLLFIEVAGDRMPMDFPVKKGDFPPLPEFLNDIEDDEIHVCRRLVYGWDEWRRKPGRNAADAKPPLKPNQAPHYTIDGKQFQDEVVDQKMRLGNAEEWTIYNETSIAHPFHIHVNPFQIVEVFEPNAGMKRPVRFVSDMTADMVKYGTSKTLVQGPPVWWDVFAIPVAEQDKNGVILGHNGRAKNPGYFTMRSRFVDFTGQYVQHCHILAHEDRGMMQLLEVVDDYHTKVKHH